MTELAVAAVFNIVSLLICQLCRAGTLDPRKVNGKIVSCTPEGKIKSVAEGQEALSAVCWADDPISLGATIRMSPARTLFGRKPAPPIQNSQVHPSMSCPHVSVIAGLLKTPHPSCTPAAIKSAIMTTGILAATTFDNTSKPTQDAFDEEVADPFTYGLGHVRPDLAVDPGLVYDLGLTDYLNFLCASGYD
ncbi:hypothetical protein VNO78_15111 [Psophocarpus tetragonolobus]|uniref:Peptidase S8/S53 domain-containing protein n=1 Tax=Psophocarpus tetragonolobus TaxID=3891 RepID=A0AAN9SFD6_PSOTE